MRRPLNFLSSYSALIVLILSPVLISGTSKKDEAIISEPIAVNKTATPSAASTNVSIDEVVPTSKTISEANALYENMKLKRVGLSQKAFEYAWKGYRYMLSKRMLNKTDVLSICDFSQSSRRKRLYVIDVAAMKLLLNTHVAHGRNSGGEYARSFSNSMESHKSSLGFYITRGTYFGGHGLSLQIDGLERGINDKANARRIVVHGSTYVGDQFLRTNPFNGRSYGCPAVPAKHTARLINMIKNGSCLFIYHPTKNYISKSRILNI